jgi:hypothetical protein
MPLISTTSAEQRVNTVTSGDQRDPAVAVLSDGGHVVAWVQAPFGPIVLQRYDASGAAVGSETPVSTTSPPAEPQSGLRDPEVAALQGGGYVVTWIGPDGSGDGVYGQLFTAAGAPVGGETNTTTAGHQVGAVVTGLGLNGYVVAWHSDEGVYQQRFSLGGERIEGETRVTGGAATDIASLVDGGYVLTWTSSSDAQTDVYAQRFSVSGIANGSAALVNTTEAGLQEDAAVAGLSGGGYVVTWTSRSISTGEMDVFAQRFRPNGAKLGGETRVNTTTDALEFGSDVVALSDGGYAVTWIRHGVDEEEVTRNVGLYLQRFNAAGDPIGGESLVNPDQLVTFAGARAAVAPDDRVITVWDARADQFGGEDIYQRSLDGFVRGSTLSEALEMASGGRGGDTFYAAPDALNTGDQVYGGAGSDKIALTAPGVFDFAGVFLKSVERLLGSRGADTFVVDDRVLSDVTDINGRGGEDTLVTHEASLDLVGKVLRNIEHVTTANPGGTNFLVDDRHVALLIEGAGADDEVTANLLTFTARERSNIFSHGVEKIVDAAGTYEAGSAVATPALAFAFGSEDFIFT